jgi:hypothetical protein
MSSTPFPTRPIDVVSLTSWEFMHDLDMNAVPSLAVVCGRFVDDANRAIVWLIRFRALQSLCARADMAEWLHAGSVTARDLCEVAASFVLNDRWEFDAERFCSAVNGVARRRSGIHPD